MGLVDQCLYGGSILRFDRGELDVHLTGIFSPYRLDDLCIDFLSLNVEDLGIDPENHIAIRFHLGDGVGKHPI